LDTCSAEERPLLAIVMESHRRDIEMGNNKDPRKTRPGEMPPGRFHFNPGNMSGKKIGNAERGDEDAAAPLDQEVRQKPSERTK